jgi:acetyltransferase-like isoleucine patch superfamily enzyme
VLIGSNVKILKGVQIGKNAIIANGTVVSRSIPENAVAFGNPMKAGLGLVLDN